MYVQALHQFKNLRDGIGIQGDVRNANCDCYCSGSPHKDALYHTVIIYKMVAISTTCM